MKNRRRMDMDFEIGDENDGLISIIEDLIACYGWMNVIFRAKWD